MQSDVPRSSSVLDGLFLEGLGLMDGLVLPLGLLLLFLLLSAVFSTALRAFLYLDASAFETLLKQDDRASTRVQRLLRKPGRLYFSLAGIVTLAHAGIVVVAVSLALRAGAEFGVAPLASTLAALLLVTPFILFTSRLVPHLVRSASLLQVATHLSSPVWAVRQLLLPLTIPAEWLVRSLFGWMDRTWPPRSIVVHSLSPPAVEEADREEQEEQVLIDSVVAFRDTTVREIMISRMDMVGLPVDATLDDALEIIRTSGHSRLPLYEDHLDDIVGVVYTKDILPYLDPSSQNGVRHPGQQPIEWHKIARPAMFVPVDRPLNIILQQFREKKTHLAIAVDEYGGTAGIVTLEDVLEEIVGDIRDEHDVEDIMARKVGVNLYRVDARINLDDLGAVLNRDFSTEEFDFETLGGLVYHCAGDIPEEGDEVAYDTLRMRVVRVDSHRIVEVLIFVDTEQVVEDTSQE